MKNSVFIFLIATLLLFSACGDDEGEVEIIVNNDISIGSVTHAINFGAVNAFDANESENTAEYDIALSSNRITISNDGGFIVDDIANTTVDIRFRLVSSGLEDIAAGTYIPGTVGAGEAGVFFITKILIDGTTYSDQNGTISVAGSNPNFTIALNFELVNDSTLIGGFAGTYISTITEDTEDPIDTDAIEENQIGLDGQVFDVRSGAFRTNNVNQEDNTTQIDFGLSDNEVIITESGFSFPSDASIAIIFSLISKGQNGAAPGNYTLGDNVNPVAGSFFITRIEIDEINYTESSGTVVLTGTSPDFTIDFSIELDNGQTLLGNYSDTFTTN